MRKSYWDEKVKSMTKILMQPIIFNDLKITLVEVVGAHHDDDWQSTYHRHPWFEFNYVSHGAVYTRMENTEFLVEEGNIFLIPPGVMHSHRHYKYKGDDGFCVRWELEHVLLPESANPIKLADDFIAAFSHYQPRSYSFAAESLFENVDHVSIFQLETVFLKWLMQVYHLLNPDTVNTHGNWEDHRNNSIVKQVLMYLEEYSEHNIDVKELADSVGYSYRHLARLLKEKTGSTIIEKLNSIRITKAIYLLENTDMTISEICSKVGFNTETYFSTIFNEFTHMPPSVFRNKYKRK